MSDVQPSRHELHVQLKMPVRSSRRVVTHVTGTSTKWCVSVEMAGSTYSGTRNSREDPADMAVRASTAVA